ncbi:hypothetical protein KsCSTR_28010 [Candidatus Kuenenia stuttgartiensis]|uniref:DUF262 domain-containing protein n=1 Tax=Kuenenia stuttgartiensis TaxID=174633 RepID=A0A2C9CCS8_KUEST|nr:DUF262 domain-containing protein [Candidatus Kuenenia stuttgartiensis]MBZ0190252.1 DUF262 domain-containing HNH endonuclease family protein [Candidatus Kuenenia stuttgartiensis]QII12180.1 hypothetical protein KsCSTR_28010 [Candidatus Kuenenia stuttgartiensis]GJQ48550.1 MAG: hypothetical protein HKUEN01_09360 [Candidatus Kuenenia stuttgartiensis]SOH02527.1 hypothetical protein KSMBR1_0005 [Candidatus Kuenenia stuttgartiensis]
MSKIDFQIKGIGALIKEHQFSVPNYQRAYKWEDEHIKSLFSDLSKAIDNNESEYFLGTVVLSQKEGSKELEIVDGQQRITTIAIFLSAIRNYFFNNGKSQSANSIQTDFISNYDTRNEENVAKLKLGNQDRTFFQKYIVDNIDEKPTKGSHFRIVTAKDESTKKVKTLSALSETQVHNWKDFILDKLKVVSIIVPGESNAFTLFETLNDRGLVLAQTDLLKNYLFSRAGDYFDEVQFMWIEMTAKIEDALGESSILIYIKHFWSSRNGLTRPENKQLYKSISDSKKSPTDVRDFVKELNDDTKLYIAINNHKDNYWKEHTEHSKNYIETLNYLELEPYKPLVLSILKRFDDKKEVEKSLKLIVSWVVRNLITGSLRGGTLESEYAEKAKNIYNNTIKTAKEFRDKLKVIPSDSEFKERLLTITLSKEKFARYYLRAIENQYKGNGNPECIVNSDPNVVDLEHILPKKPKQGEWPNFTSEEVDEYSNRLGNLTVMSKKDNSNQKNESFKKKKENYKKSEIKITNEIEKNFTEWNKDTIINRQAFLAEIAVKTWNLRLD